jgi:phage repressor protein C with HTH and peptisase S24 domain
LLRRQGRLTLDDVASRTGISKAYLSQVENGRVDPPRDAKVRALEEAFGLRPGELLELAHLARTPRDVRERLEQLRSAFDRAEQTVQALMVQLPQESEASGEGCGSAGPAGTGEMARGVSVEASSSVQPQDSASGGDGGSGNVTVPQAVLRRIPIINGVAAGYPAEFTDLDYPAGVADAYVGAPPDLDDPGAFAVRVVGDSMEPRYREGDIVLFAPSAAVRSGDDCYVRFTPESPQGATAMFKRVYFDNATEARLQPLNERYPPTVVPLEHIAGLYRAVCRYETL